jgi:uncharacterized membrane protein YjjP (DUF1212 family)
MAAPTPPPPVSAEASVRFLVDLARALHRYGTTAHRLENALNLVARRLRLEAQFFSTPTAVFVSIQAPAEPQTILIRVDPGQLDLGKLVELDAVASEVMRGELTVTEAGWRVRDIDQAPDRYGPWLTTFSFALASATAAEFFGGGWREILAGSVVGLLIGLFARVSANRPALGRVFDPAAAALASFVATLLALWLPPLAVYTVTVSGLIVLVPGLSLTLAISELATRDLASGSARLAGTIMTFLAIAFGVALGAQVAWRLAGAWPPAVTPVGLPVWGEIVALLFAPLGFVVLFRASLRDAPWIVLSGLVAFFSVRLGGQWLGPQLGAFVGAAAVGAGSNVFARALDRPAAVTQVPGIVFLVPGSVGFQSLSSLLERDVVSGVGTAFQMTLVASALVTGLLVANVLVPPRKAL